MNTKNKPNKVSDKEIGRIIYNAESSFRANYDGTPITWEAEQRRFYTTLGAIARDAIKPSPAAGVTDGEMLDWLGSKTVTSKHHCLHWGISTLRGQGPMTIREAITAAIKEHR